MELGLRAYRANKGYSIAYVAHELGVNPNTISKWERGETIPGKLALEAMAKLYGVDPSQIFLKRNSK